ncbi:DUF423 domain-containing protein [Pseudohongiella sp. SYSU M77423]|uniref:DUF423 domain-containing protein n=1 Tax=unclassified Pseudohongiella TaxID=2629611 RepID=UPI001F2EA44A|nr:MULTISPECIES: DUF423 domain-containing protein [unclassified Pseudohongiella]MDH7944378.1 DUF423 domain-containing protein [Pseudohongiella sp. SYSU M77423]MEC8860739.1 DUF423 domain-containing protein [Pseudomonadota bacterium]
MPAVFVAIAAINGFLAVALGAFAAHGLRARLPEDLLTVFQTGVQYHMYHALALFGVGLLCMQYGESTLLRASGWAFVVGIVIFSGSLYILSLSGIRWLGAITPIGGVAFLTGWLLLAAAMLMGRS